MLNKSILGLLLVLIGNSVTLVSCSPKLQNLVNGSLGAGIINGQTVAENDPISASIVGIYDVKEKAECTGSLIAENIVLTAAHCVGGRASDLRIVFSNDLDDVLFAREVDVRSARLLIATDYKVNPRYYSADQNQLTDKGDIALIKFKGALPAGYKPATFLTDSSEIKVGAIVTLAGYGVNLVETTVIDPKKYPHLKDAIADGQVYCTEDSKQCMESVMSGDGILRRTQAPIAVLQRTEVELDERTAGTCSGDSGGPAYIEKNGQYLLFGITSRGSAFCDDTGVYTNALTYFKWIQDTIKTLN